MFLYMQLFQIKTAVTASTSGMSAHILDGHVHWMRNKNLVKTYSFQINTVIEHALESYFTGLEKCTSALKSCAVIDIYTRDEAWSGKKVFPKLSSCSLNALSDGASATEGGSLFHDPTTWTANAVCRRTSWIRGCRTWNWCPRRWFTTGASNNSSGGRFRLPWYKL